MSSDGYFHVPRRLLQAKIPQERKYALIWFIGQASFAPREVDGVSLAVGETPAFSLTRLEDEFRWSRKAVRVFLDYATSEKCAEETHVRLRIGQKCTGHSQGHREGHSQGHTYHVATKRVKAGEGHSLGHSQGHSAGHSIKEEGLEEGKKTTLGLSARVRGMIEYTEVFNRAWSSLPQRAGSDSKAAAFRAFEKSRKEGCDPEEMAAGAERYGEFCDATGKSGTEFVMQGQKFFGRDRWWEREYGIPESNGNGKHR